MKTYYGDEKVFNSILRKWNEVFQLVDIKDKCYIINMKR
jgi:hypothetical protein